MKYIPYNQLSTHNEDKGRVKRESHRQVEEGVIRKMITEMVFWNTSANFFFFKSYVGSQQEREGKIKMSCSRGGTGPLLSAMASPLSFWEECEGPLDLTAGEGQGLRKADPSSSPSLPVCLPFLRTKTFLLLPSPSTQRASHCHYREGWPRDTEHSFLRYNLSGGDVCSFLVTSWCVLNHKRHPHRLMCLNT